MIKIPIKTKDDAMKLFNLFKRKEEEGLEKALAAGLITEEEKLRIAAQRANDALNSFLQKQKPKTKRLDK
jgi:hypothetical protein